jgi:hypothetical protein
MSNVSIPTSLPHHIEQLLSKRHDHVSAIAVIDATLARVTAALGGLAGGSANGPAVKLVKPAKTVAAKVAPAIVAKAPKIKIVKTRKPRKDSRYAMTANDLVISFITAKKNPTSQEVTKYWKEHGRNGTPDNTLSLLTKAKKLKRTPLGKGIRGSRYSLV